MPLHPTRHNVFLSVVDSLASGIPIVASRRPGFEELEREQAPVVFHAEDRAPESLAAQVRALLESEARGPTSYERAVGYTKERLDIYRILERIVEAELQ
jgi:glycosyltransferase involved in cell wall biosynthesis